MQYIYIVYILSQPFENILFQEKENFINTF